MVRTYYMIAKKGPVTTNGRRQDDHPLNPQTRPTTESVLREAMQALVRVQAHMLAGIVVEIHPRCRHRCRVGTCDVFYADNAH